MSYIESLKRAAKNNPAWHVCGVYRQVPGDRDENGYPMQSYVETTWATVETAKADHFNLPDAAGNYVGKMAVNVITARALDSDFALSIGGRWFLVCEISGANVLAAECRCIVHPTDAPLTVSS